MKASNVVIGEKYTWFGNVVTIVGVAPRFPEGDVFTCDLDKRSQFDTGRYKDINASWLEPLVTRCPEAEAFLSDLRGLYDMPTRDRALFINLNTEEEAMILGVFLGHVNCSC